MNTKNEPEFDGFVCTEDDGCHPDQDDTVILCPLHAASPDLLAAAEECERKLCRLQGSKGWGEEFGNITAGEWAGPEVQGSVDLLRAAIQRARGGMSVLRDIAEDVARVVFAPDYDSGPWFVYFQGRRKVCANKGTAEAWAEYLVRRFGSWSRYGIGVGKAPSMAAAYAAIQRARGEG